MKKLLFVLVLATTMPSCVNTEFEEICQEYRAAVEEDADDVNFRIFKDRTQTGKEK